MPARTCSSAGVSRWTTGRVTRPKGWGRMDRPFPPPAEAAMEFNGDPITSASVAPVATPTVLSHTYGFRGHNVFR